jgi:hypothetical protein
MNNRAGLFGKKRDSINTLSFPLRPTENRAQQDKTAVDSTLYRQRHLGNRIMLQIVESNVTQAKLKVGSPNDKYEEEADQVADQVMRMPDGTSVQRKSQCPECMDEEDEPLQRKEITGLTSEIAPGVETDLRNFKKGGQPLPESTRSFFEPRFGADFSQVRVHPGSEAAQAAQSVDAHAFTSGNNIVFNQNKYSPGTPAGKHLLAHELTHVIQQGHGQPNRRFDPPVSMENASPGPVLQRTQVARPGYGQESATYFVYELDDDRYLPVHLEEYYGVPARIIMRHNPGKSATSLQKGQRMRVPAINPPINLQPVSLSSLALGLTMNVKTNDLNVRWNSAPDANIIGTVPRGNYLYFIPGNGYFLPLPYLINPRQGIIKEMEKLGLIGGGFIYCFVPGANVRDVYAPVSTTDIDLMARMIWGEQKNRSKEVMIAAGWTARNRFDAGWGTYPQIITKAQYHGLVEPKDVPKHIPGKDKSEALIKWELAQSVAKEVVEGTIPDPTGGFKYFGNEFAGSNVLKKMLKCASRNPEFKYYKIGTDFYYCNGDYTTQPSCPIR